MLSTAIPTQSRTSFVIPNWPVANKRAICRLWIEKFGNGLEVICKQIGNFPARQSACFERAVIVFQDGQHYFLGKLLGERVILILSRDLKNKRNRIVTAKNPNYEILNSYLENRNG